MSTEPTLSELPYNRPDLEELRAAAQALQAAWDAVDTAAPEATQAQLDLIRRWDAEQSELGSLRTLASIRFAKQIADKEEKEFFDQIDPDLQEWNLDFLRRVIASPHRQALQAELGPQALALWELALSTFEPAIADDKRAESELINRYDSLLAALEPEFQGSKTTLARLRGYFGDADRAVRQDARRVQDQALGSVGEQVDEIFDELVRLRHKMATTLGYERFTELGYRNMARTDYGPEQVAAFRQQVVDEVVPLCTEIVKRRAATLGLGEQYSYADESVRDHLGVPKPKGDHDWMMERAQGMFDTLGTDFGQFFTMLRQRDLMDLKARDGKKNGGFCEFLPSHKLPFIFANFNGTQDDVNVFTHECGHAFQSYSSRNQPLRDLVWPTYEAAEIHSMGMEFLAWPHMERFFGDDAERFRQGHLEDALLFLPYGCAVDEFQHRVYAEPTATTEQRAAWWKEIEARYLPHRQYPELPHFESGRLWHRQGHVFWMPFYYIDYCLAQTCALQLWSRANVDREATMALYRELCTLGGSLPFTGLLDAVGLDNPFEPGCLTDTVQQARQALGL